MFPHLVELGGRDVNGLSGRRPEWNELGLLLQLSPATAPPLPRCVLPPAAARAWEAITAAGSPSPGWPVCPPPLFVVNVCLIIDTKNTAMCKK